MSAPLSNAFFVKQGEWEMAVLFYVFGSVGFAAGNIFYDSLLPDVASKIKRTS